MPRGPEPPSEAPDIDFHKMTCQTFQLGLPHFPWINTQYQHYQNKFGTQDSILIEKVFNKGLTHTCSITVDESLDSLLHLHERSSYNARSGSNGNQNAGSQGPLK